MIISKITHVQFTGTHEQLIEDSIQMQLMGETVDSKFTRITLVREYLEFMVGVTAWDLVQVYTFEDHDTDNYKVIKLIHGESITLGTQPGSLQLQTEEGRVITVNMNVSVSGRHVTFETNSATPMWFVLGVTKQKEWN